MNSYIKLRTPTTGKPFTHSISSIRNNFKHHFVNYTIFKSLQHVRQQHPPRYQLDLRSPLWHLHPAAWFPVHCNSMKRISHLSVKATLTCYQFRPKKLPTFHSNTIYLLGFSGNEKKYRAPRSLEEYEATIRSFPIYRSKYSINTPRGAMIQNSSPTH